MQPRTMTFFWISRTQLISHGTTFSQNELNRLFCAGLAVSLFASPNRVNIVGANFSMAYILSIICSNISLGFFVSEIRESQQALCLNILISLVGRIN